MNPDPVPTGTGWLRSDTDVCSLVIWTTAGLTVLATLLMALTKSTCDGALAVDELVVELELEVAALLASTSGLPVSVAAAAVDCALPDVAGVVVAVDPAPAVREQAAPIARIRMRASSAPATRRPKPEPA